MTDFWKGCSRTVSARLLSPKIPAQHYAARFAAKEAVLKAIGTGWSAGIKWTDMEVLHGEEVPDREP